jgi:Cytochrome c554 and c-prime
MRWIRTTRAGPFLSLLGLTLWFGGTFWLLRAASGQEPAPIPATAAAPGSTPRAPISLTINGAGSCSAVACHGSIAPLGGGDVLRNEHTTWISDDPHSRAYQTLSSTRSEQIARNLLVDPNRYVPARQDLRCVACHATPRPEAESRTAAWMNQDGVGCESCHGPSEKWLSEHYSTTWKNVPTVRDKEQLGFYDMKNLVRRAEICAGCHVGRHARATDLVPLPLRDVNHDLIAAGHPRLTFELAAYHENIPKHWKDKGRNASPDLPARLWSVGQAVTAKTALELLADRASHNNAPWPEFSEYGCFSCHHDLADQGWRSTHRLGLLDRQVPPGSLQYGTWYLPLALTLFDIPLYPAARDQGKSFRTTVDVLLKEMSKPVPMKKQAATTARECARLLERCLEPLSAHDFSVAEIERLVDSLNAPEAWRKVGNWDAASQRYLALVPLLQVWSKVAPNRASEQQRLKAKLDSLLINLRFPTGFDSPRKFDPAQFGKP